MSLNELVDGLLGDPHSPPNLNKIQVVEEKGNHEENLEIDRERAAHYIQLPGDKGLAADGDR
jgi:hypothetical protein